LLNRVEWLKVRPDLAPWESTMALVWQIWGRRLGRSRGSNEGDVICGDTVWRV
jgi:hypothetical protein